MAQRQFVSYSRVSTTRQGHSGLGLEAQKATVEAYVNRSGGTIVAGFIEVETGSGGNALDRRPQLRAAIALCKKEKATLVIAKVDRLARNVHFVSGLIESGVDFVAADMPNANKTMIQIHAVMSEWERDAISQRTKEALAAAKARGVVLGATGPRNLRAAIGRLQAEADAFADKMRDTVLGLQARNLSQRAIARELNALGVKSPRDGRWHPITVHRLVTRLAMMQR